MIGRLRLLSGLILTVYLVGHMLNHALGIISIQAMNDMLKYSIAPWRTPTGTVLMLGSLAVHVVLALHSLYMRRQLAMRPSDWVQLVSGILIPIVLASHVLGTRGIYEVFEIEKGYQFFLFGMWFGNPVHGILVILGLALAWVHTCMGWHYWLRLKSWYPPLQIYALVLAIILPTLALAGYASASFYVVRRAANEAYGKRLLSSVADILPEITAFVTNTQYQVWAYVVSGVAFVLLARWLRELIVANRATVPITYRDFELSNEQKLAMVPGENLLERIRALDIPHAAVCGGRGRCSTCRVRIEKGASSLEPPSANEQKVLARINAEPDVRLACQLVPKETLDVTALLAPEIEAGDINRTDRDRGGEEQEITVLFADIRSFTKISETQLPYDTAFLLNRYFATMGQAIEEAGGHLDKFIGDGVMALFGVDENTEIGCRKALIAAAKMSRGLKELNRRMEGDLESELRIGIGIHSGTAIVGKMGYRKAIGLTAIGDTVNTASRIESMTKDFGVQLIVSERTAEASGVDLTEFELVDVTVRGREERLPVRIIKSADQVQA